MSEDAKVLVNSLRDRAVNAREENNATAISDAWHFEHSADAIERLTRELSEATTRAERAEAALERDRTAVITACNKVCEEMAGRAWLLEGRGPYEWDDDRYRQEFSTALRAIEAPIEALRKIGRDWSNCPSDPQSISDAREDWKARAERAEAKAENLDALLTQRFARSALVEEQLARDRADRKAKAANGIKSTRKRKIKSAPMPAQPPQKRASTRPLRKLTPLIAALRPSIILIAVERPRRWRRSTRPATKPGGATR